MIFAIILFAIGASIIASHNLNNVTEHNLEQYLDIVSDDYTSYLDTITLLQNYADYDQTLRITVLDPSGVVVADSILISTENHLLRPEIVNIGEAFIRYSETLNKRMMYMAMEMDDGGYLRVAIPTSSFIPFLNDFIGLSIVIGTLIIIGAYFLVGIATNKTLAPLRETVSSLSAVAKGEYIERLPLEQSEELNQIINDINDISRMIATNINELNIEKQKIDFILNHMEQGLCVLDANLRVVLVNRFVENLFQFKPDLNLNKDYLYLFRNPVVQKIITDISSNEEGLLAFFSENDREYSVSASKTKTSWSHTELLLLIFSDITAMKQIETLKRDFFVNASHELKSPLTSIIGASELISSNIVSKPEEIKDLADRVLQEAKRMNNLVGDMLSLSKYENPLLSKNEVLVEFDTLIKEVSASLESQAFSKKIELITYLEPVSLMADYEHLTQLVRNLMDNAIQYGVENGHVTVKLYQLGEDIRLEVIDDGIGIPKEYQTRVFERFYRVDKARSKKTGGTGLGLAIVKHICAIYRAQISLESEPNKGTKIQITIPSKSL
jgi:two-component system phosphate regulon sensor histidine kinase PhoR